MIYILIVFFVIFLFKLYHFLRFYQVRKFFIDKSVIVFGSRGSGKDLLMSNVVAYNNKPYCSNMDYCEGLKNAPFRIPYSSEYLRLHDNTFASFVNGTLKPYDYPLPDRCDFYISDAGVYFPAQEFSKLNKIYPDIPLFQALVRHLGDCNFHVNIQNLNRLWDKIREQAELYIYCKSCRFTKRGIVKQTIIVYDRYESALNKVEPLVIRKPLLGKQVRSNVTIEKAKFQANFGNVIKINLRYKNKGRYDSRRFKTMLATGRDNYIANDVIYNEMGVTFNEKNKEC